ncbi:MAG: GspE/PulE family protein [Patescibacteria group bacterium]
MSDLGNINDLLVNNNKIKISSDETEGVFDKKMTEIKEKELEIEAQRFAAKINFPHINLTKFPVSHDSLKQIEKETALKIGAVCFYYDNEEIRIGALDPTAVEVEELLHDLKSRKNVGGALYVISPVSFKRVMRLYDTMPNVKPISKDIEIKLEDLEKVSDSVVDFRSIRELLKTGQKISEMITIILGAGMKTKASDIHIEAEEGKIILRFRLDGILHDVAELPKDLFEKLLSRIKLQSSLKINIVNKPQDGRFTIKKPGGDVDVRVSTIPTVYGESIVMRLLFQDEKGVKLEDLGLSTKAFDLLKQEIQRPNGMIITTGPTGSGKTTTLYSILHILNKPGVKIITLEDPVEYRLEGINQSQIDRSKDYTFAKGLRSILRQDPDIVMVGEIRDLETADIAVQAALTGHLMLSTLHTNNAAGTIPRFLAMGLKPFLLAPALNCMMGQRLVRRLCPHCKKEIDFANLPEVQKKKVEKIISTMPNDEKKNIEENKKFFVASERGCEKCSGIGYKGRIGIYEIYIVNKDIENAISAGNVAESFIEELLHKQGFLSMVEDGVVKANQGITSLEEVFRVID